MHWIKRWAVSFVLRCLGAPHRLIDFDALEHKKIKLKPIKAWLFSSMTDTGWQNYYSYRNYELLEAAGLAKSHEDHLVLVGRLFELRALRENMRLAGKRIKDAENKQLRQEAKEKGRVKIR